MRMRPNGLLSCRSHPLPAIHRPSSSSARVGASVPPCLSQHERFLKSNARHHATASPAKSIGVLGGGITGLATAKYLNDAFPHAQITVLEKSNRLGGWMQTHNVADDIVFESGPRSLRPSSPNGVLAMRLVEDIGLTDSLLVTSTDHPAAKNRFIYYPDRLLRLPSPGVGWPERLQTLWSSGFISSAWRASWPSQWPSQNTDDESVGHFLSRLIGEGAVNNMVSAGFHGIYAGDVWQLSARSIMPWVWEAPKRYTSIWAYLQGSMNKEKWSFTDDTELQTLLQHNGWSESLLRHFGSNASVFSFQKGIQELPDTLAEYLRQMPNIRLVTGSQITSLERRLGSGQDKMAVGTANAGQNQDEQLFDHVVSTISSKRTHALMSGEVLKKTPGLNALSRTHAVSVAVVNLHFPVTDLLKKLRLPQQPIFNEPLCGFGYLIPNSISLTENPERALGVIFDSDIFSPGPDSDRPAENGTRLTVMMGGHWWDDWDELPSESDCVEMAKSVLQRHLGIEEAPNASKATIQHECIPQYHVGHTARMAQAHEGLKDAFGGRLLVAGSWYTGVGVNDCLRAGFDAAHTLRTRVKGTGLEMFKEGRPMSLIKTLKPGLQQVVRWESEKGRVSYERWK